jgi:hypothetical protein
MMGPKDLEVDEPIFEGLALEEPSARTDEAILAFAGERLVERRRDEERRSTRRRCRSLLGRSLLVHAGIAAAIVIGLFLALRERGGPAGNEAAASAPRRAATAPLEVGPLDEIAELRSELDEIGEMSELIPEDRREERVEIGERVRLCLKDLEDLELRLRSIEQGSLDSPERKEARI